MKAKEKPNPRKNADLELIDNVLIDYGLITKKQKKDRFKK
jgi:hypothetical protein